VRKKPGAQVTITGWGGGKPLHGRVKCIEPSAFSKVSALGVEEQRVWVVIDITSPRAEWAGLSDGFRVEVAIVADELPQALIVPIGEGMWDCDARAELDDVAEMVDPRLAEVEEAVDTLGGLAFVLAEAVPPVGTVLEHPSGWRIEVTAGDETHVTRLRLHPPMTGEDVQ
jgi:hypothetical protein